MEGDTVPFGVHGGLLLLAAQNTLLDTFTCTQSKSRKVQQLSPLNSFSNPQQ
jgi:hypothetical protein